MADSRQRLFFPNTDIRGEIIQLDQALAPILSARDYPLAINQLLGEAVVAAALMVGTLKFNGRLSLQAQGNGLMSLLLAEATNDNSLRGLARWTPAKPAADNAFDQGTMPSLNTLLGNQAQLAITLHPDQGQDYQSLVPLQGDSIAACLSFYFEQSEQLPTNLWLACGNGKAAGILLQRLPTQNGTEQHNSDQWQTLSALINTLTQEELLSLEPSVLMHRLFHQTPPEVSAPSSLHFACTCRRERVQQMLISLGRQTLQSMLDEQQHADITCEFCHQTQSFDAVDLAQLIHQASDADQR